jgi:phosphate transport system protein
MKKFDRECAALKRRLIEMGQLGQSMIHRAVEALANRDTNAIKEVRAKEKVMDRLQVEIDDEAIRLITIYTPVAGDLRFLLMASRSCSELERIGDLARNMGKYVKLLVSQPELKPPDALLEMADLVRSMVRDALDAFDRRDAKMATETIKLDEQVDDLDDAIFRELVGNFGGDVSLTSTVALILLSRTLERIADHATNICEEVVYLVEAKDIRHSD